MATAPATLSAAPTVDMTAVTRAHINIRDERSRLRKEWEAVDGTLKESQVKLENVLLDHLTKTNSESVRTEAGTFYRQEEVIPNAADWNAFYDWIRDNNAFDALERRIKKTFVTEYMDANDGALPPGVSTFRQFVVRVRRPS